MYNFIFIYEIKVNLLKTKFNKVYFKSIYVYKYMYKTFRKNSYF